MNKSSILLSLIAAPFLIVGCGGGSSSTTTTNTMAKITGTVPGTLIETYCDNNYYAQVTSTQNGTNKHPFSVSVPTNTNCRMVMTTNENSAVNRVITPITFKKNGTVGKTVTINQNTNLGNVPLPTSPTQVATAAQVTITPFVVDVNGTAVGAVTNATIPGFDKDGNGEIDNYQDNDTNGIPNAYEDYDNDGIVNIHDDANGNGVPDFDEANNGNDMNGGGNDANNGNDRNGNAANNGNDRNGNAANNGNDRNGNAANNG